MTDQIASILQGIGIILFMVAVGLAMVLQNKTNKLIAAILDILDARITNLEEKK